MTETVFNGRLASDLIARAKAAGWTTSEIVGELGVSTQAMSGWKSDPECLPYRTAQRRLRCLADKLDRAERRKGAGK